MIGRIPILDVSPVVGCGRWPARAVVGESFHVTATVFREGHEAVNANVVLRDPDGKEGPWTPMTALADQRWRATVTPTSTGRWSYAVEAWGDPVASWRHDAEIKVPAEQDVELMLEEGARLMLRAAQQPRPARDAQTLTDAATALRDTSRPAQARLAEATSEQVSRVLAAAPLRDLVTSSEQFALEVDRERALYGAWYELFPRSEGAVVDPSGQQAPTSGTFRTAMVRLPAVAAMGFDVVYLPPVHPIGTTARKGPNNTLTHGQHDPGVPWAIGSAEGGHDTIHPDLGTFDDFDAFVERTRELGMEVALDLAVQASPDHPWVTEHPEWFTTRVDGSIAYAENPPKKYQDMFPVNFDNDPQGIRAEVLRIVTLWMSHGVRIFRVDNPHTKPVAFWHWLFAEIRRTDPDVLFLAEAFTIPPMMQTLGKVGFHQSYTYFTWRDSKEEFEEYLTQLSTESAHFMRPNFWVNTPDILAGHLQSGGPPMFKIRATLAATMTPSWGVYSGFELYEHVAVRPGSEEYLDSEKYQYRPRDWAAAEREGRTLAPYLTLLNDIRRRHPALHRLRGITFHPTDSPDVLAYSKHETVDRELAHEDTVIVVVNLDPHGARETTVHLDMAAFGLPYEAGLTVRDEVTGNVWQWGAHNYVRLDPFVEPAHILAVQRTDT